MRTVWKILIGAGIALVVLTIAVVALVSSVDLDTLIGPVKDRVKAATGRDLAIRGGAHVALSLEPKVVLRDVALSNAPWGSAKEMVTAERVEVELALLPLLSRRIEVKEVALVAPVIALETDGKGQKNWSLAAPTAPASPATPATSGGLEVLPAGNLAITRGTITYRDGATGHVTRAAIDKMSVRGGSVTSKISAEFQGTVDGIAIALDGTFGPAEALIQKRWPYPVDVKGEVAGQKLALSTKLNADATRYKLDDLKISFGANALTGSFAVVTGGPRPRLIFDLLGPVLAFNTLPLPVAPGKEPPAVAPPAKTARAQAIPDMTVDFGPLLWVDAQGTLAVGKLTLANGRQYDNLRVQLALDGGQLEVPSFSLALMGGVASGTVTVDAKLPERATLTARVEGNGLALGAILTTLGHPREVRGGRTDVSINLAMQGNSPRAWLGSANGSFRAVVGPATLVNTKMDLESVFDKVNQAINPFRASDPSTELICTVVRFPLANGVARFDRTVAMETKKVGVSASGTLDFRNETLDVQFHPKVRQGISIDIASLADLVRVTGPFSSPRMNIDPAGSAKVIASIGAAVGTGGLSAVGQALFAWSQGSGPGPCQVALGAAPNAAPATPANTAGAQPANAINEVGKAVGKLFGR
jgi:uncharacterized protein involved in outer membrane biogenesis